MIQALLLAALGALLGLLATVAARPRTPQGNFNNVRGGILGALIGGLLLPRAISGATVSSSGVDAGSLLTGAVLATAFLAILTLWQHWLLGRR